MEECLFLPSQSLVSLMVVMEHASFGGGMTRPVARDTSFRPSISAQPPQLSQTEENFRKF
jgi:hypothetical protein